MKTIRTVIFLVVVSTVLSSCYKRDNWAVRGKGENVTETRGLSHFEAISISVDGEVEYTQDSIFKVEITGQQNILAITRTEVSAGVLKIFFRGNVWDHHPLRIRIHSPKMRSMELSGSANITALKPVMTEGMTCDISGSGNITIPELKSTAFNANISGSGSISVDAGSTDSENLVISGSGNINCGNFVSSKSQSRISGSGNITTHVKDELTATISGSGDIRYRGKPLVNVSVSGSGRVVHLD